MKKYKECLDCKTKNEINVEYCIECEHNEFHIIESDEKQQEQLNNIENSEYKICKICGEKNEKKEPFCLNCGECSWKDDEVNNSSSLKQLTVKINEKEFILKHNDIVGREAKLANELKNERTISRKHFQLFFDNNEWFIEDLNSTNGTFINDQKILPKTKCLVANNDTIKLSTNINLIVIK